MRRLPLPVCRLVYRLAWAILHLWWLLRHPRVRGVKCVLTDGERVLLVRHTYGRRGWNLPGGRLHHGEMAALGASREINEELGIVIGPEGWRSLGTCRGRMDGRRDELHLFTAPAGGQRMTIDACELAEAAWFPRAHLPAPETLGREVARIVALVGGS